MYNITVERTGTREPDTFTADQPPRYEGAFVVIRPRKIGWQNTTGGVEVAIPAAQVINVRVLWADPSPAPTGALVPPRFMHYVDDAPKSVA